jgi:predicted permease
MVDPGYLQTMRIPLVSGRYFEPTDTLETEPVIIVNETAARALLPDGDDPINRILVVNDEELRIVGVVADVRHSALEEESDSEMYILATQHPLWWVTVELVARSPLPAASLAGGVRAAVHAVDPDLPVSNFRALSEIVDRAVSPRRFILLLIEAFAISAMVLASLGIYGVLSFSVSQRTKEMGIRMALGAQASQMRRQVLARTLVLTSLGIVVGLVGALVLSRLIASLLYGVTSTDPITYACVTILLTLTAALAGYLPARRASRVDPMTVLMS